MTQSRPEILSGLADILNEVVGLAPDKVVPEASFSDDLEVDSLSMVEVVVACEEKFGVRIPDDKLESLRTVGDAVDFIEAAGVAA